MTAIEEFRAAMRAAGLDHAGPIMPDGKLHRFKVEGDNARNSWFLLHADPPMAGAFGCWKRGISEPWHEKRGEKFSDAEWKRIRESWQRADAERERVGAERHAEARAEAARILDEARPVKSHPYLDGKGVKVFGDLREYQGKLVLPLRDVSGVIQSLQYISADGTKIFLTGGRVKGSFFTLSENADQPLVICEGYSTGASIREANGFAVVCAMNCGNLKAVAETLRAKSPKREIIIAADNDQWTVENPGLTKAREAATAISARLAVPKFTDVSTKPTDFNDLHRMAGPSEMLRQIESARLDASVKLLSELVRHIDGDPGELLRYRFLCRWGILLLCGPTGIGKSSWAVQAMLLWALGLEFFGIVPARPLRSLLIQAENDEGDLAEMRDGVLAGLDFTPRQREMAMAGVVVHTEDTRTSTRFFSEVVAPRLEQHRPDLLWIDPALAYIGGESNSQKDVGGFLRNGLNPLLHQFNCGAIVLHHTNKPSRGEEKAEWKAGDFAYLGGGSAEWANAARAVLAIRSVGSHEVFELVAGKRGSRLGWKDQAGVTLYARHIGHAKEPGVICWRDAEAPETSNGGRPKGADESDVLSVLPPGGLTSKEWQDKADEEYGVSRASFFRLRKSLEHQKRIHRSPVNDRWQPVLKP